MSIYYETEPALATSSLAPEPEAFAEGPTDPEQILAEALSASQDETDPPAIDYDENGYGSPRNEHVTKTKDGGKLLSGNINQWAINGNGFFSPVSSTVDEVPAGVYSPHQPMGGPLGLLHMPINSDGIHELPDMATEVVLDEVEKFWNSEDKYRKHNLLYKRGVLLWGPPGSGKTVTVKILMKKLIERNGLVIVCQNVAQTSRILKDLRKVEPQRKIIVVFEDIDEIINYNGESHVLSLLDGEHNIDNVLNLATTNYPDRLGARICNRPSRFDRRVYVGMPQENARAEYLRRTTHNGLSDADLTKWVADTKNMSLAHMRELVASVYCLGQSYDEVIDRLKKMGTPPRVASDGFAKPKTRGFSTSPDEGYSNGEG